MRQLRWRKGGYGNQEVDILIKAAILGLARDFTLEGFPGFQGDVPSLFLVQQRRGCLNWLFPIVTLMNILHITIEQIETETHTGAQSSHSPNEEQKEGEHEQGSQDCKWVHPPTEMVGLS